MDHLIAGYKIFFFFMVNILKSLYMIGILLSVTCAKYTVIYDICRKYTAISAR